MVILSLAKPKSLISGVIAAATAGFTIGAASAARADEIFGYTGGLQSFVVPTTGVYDITAYGADGGGAGYCGIGCGGGGLGAKIGGDVTLSTGESLTILVGGAGGSGGSGGGGGGGSFVTVGTQPLVVAGGGGAGGQFVNLYNGLYYGGVGSGGNGVLFTSGSFGAGGICAPGFPTDWGGGGGGGGYSGSGGIGGAAFGPIGAGYGGGGGGSFLSGGQGGSGGAFITNDWAVSGGAGAQGGYGGGGGGGGAGDTFFICCGGGGGGGGYIGGQGGAGGGYTLVAGTVPGGGGSGGSSFLDGSVTPLVAGGSFYENGLVDIAFVGASSASGPAPGAGLLGLAFLALMGLWTKARGFLAR